jgi:hypothetical protein
MMTKVQVRRRFHNEKGFELDSRGRGEPPVEVKKLFTRVL